MKDLKLLAPVFLTLLGITAFSKNEQGVFSLTDEQKQTLQDLQWEATKIEEFNAALAVDFVETAATATPSTPDVPAPVANIETLNQTALALSSAQQKLVALQNSKNALESDKLAMQQKVDLLTEQVRTLSNKPEDDAGAGSQSVQALETVKINLSDNKQLGGLQGEMFSLQDRPYNARARAALLAAQGLEAIVPRQSSTDFTKLQEDLGAYYREQKDKTIKSFVAELPTVTGIFPLESNTKDREVITNLFLGEFSQADNSDSDFEKVVKGKYEIQAEEVRMYDVMLAHNFTNLKQMEKSWIGYLVKDSSSIKMSFVEYLMRETAKKLKSELEIRRIRGARKEPKKNEPSKALEASTGLYRYIHEKINNLQIKTTPIGEITEANIGEKIRLFVKSWPQQLIDSGMMAVYLPQAMITEYDKYNETRYGTNQDYKANIRYVKEYPSVELIAVPNAGNHRRLIGSLKDNLKCFENVPGEMLDFRFNVKEFSLSVVSQWKEGFAAPLVGKKWDRVQDMDYDHQFIFASDIDLSVNEFLAMDQDDTTPSVLFHSSIVSVANTELKTITNIDDAEVGKLIRIRCGSDAFGIKITKAGNFSTIESDWTPDIGDTITLFKRADGKFMEYSRSTATPNVVMFAANATTPSVAGARFFMTDENTAPTAITNFTDAIEGEVYKIYGAGSANASTIANSGNFQLTGAMTLSASKSITLLALPGGKFAEVERQV